MKKLFLVLSITGLIVSGAAGYILAEDATLFDKGNKLFEEKKYDEAIIEFKKGLSTNNKDDKKVLLACIGYSYQLQSKFTEASEFYKESLKIDPDYLFSIEMLGNLYMGLKDFGKGMEYNFKAENLGSKNNIIYYNMACYYSVKNDKEKAFKYLDMAIYRDYRDIESIKTDKDFENIKSDSRFVKLVSNFQFITEGDVILKKADENYNRKEYGQSIELYQKALIEYEKVLGKTSILSAFICNRLSLACQYKGDFNLAILYCEQALKIDLVIFGADHVNTATDYNNLGYVYENVKEYEKAILSFEKALKIRLSVFGKNHLDTASSLKGLGNVYYAKRDYNRAIKYYEEVLIITIAALGEKHSDTALVYSFLGSVYYTNGEYDLSILNYKKSLNIYSLIYGDKHPDLLGCLGTIALSYDYKEDYDSAIKYNEKALNICIKNYGEKNKFTATCYVNLGSTYRKKGNYDLAIKYHQKALSIYSEIFGENDSMISIICNHLGIDYRQQGDFGRSIGYHEKALSIDLSIFGDKHINTGTSYSNLGVAYSRYGDLDRAIIYHKKALPIFIEINGEKHPDTAIICFSLGSSYFNKLNYDDAILYFEKSLKIDIAVFGEKHPAVAKSYSSIGAAYIKKGNYTLAIEYLKKGLAILLGNIGEKNRYVASTYSNLGEAYKNMGDNDSAITNFKKALDIIIETQADDLKVFFSHKLGFIYVDTKQYKESLTSFLTGIATIEKVRKLNLSGGTDFTSRNINSYYFATNSGYLNNDLNSMFNISERMRAMGYIERLSLKGAMDAAGIAPEQSKKLLQLKDDIERLSSIRQKLISVPVSSMNEIQKKEHNAQFEKVSNELAQAETDFTKLDTEFMKNEKYKLLRDTSVVSVTEAQKLCGKDSAIIEYIIPEKPDKYMKPYAIIITGTSIKAVELDSAYNCSDQIGKYRKAIKDSKKSESDQLGAELYSKLIEPANSFINSIDIKKLIIVPDGSLAFLPFDSIKTKDNKYLSERYELNLTPSVTVSSMIKNRKYDKKDNLMAFGGGIYSSSGESKTRGESSFRGIAVDEKQKEKLAAKAYNSPMEYYNAQQLGWADLPGTEREVTAINEKIYNKKNTDVFTGSKVSEENLKTLSKDGKLKKYSSIHLACHGYYDPEYPGYSAVVFSEVSGKLKTSKDDGYMSVEETALLNLQSDIVVLSACETGLGRMVSGDGVIGLTRAFQVAGSNRVLVTLWPVSDDATEAFMISFYGKVKSGLSYREALVKVKDEFRRSGKSSGAADYSAPYFWAGFVLYE